MRTLILVLAIALPLFAAEGDDLSDSIAGARHSRHTILPIIGYQNLSGQQYGIDWDYTFNSGDTPGFPDSTYYYSGSERGELNSKPPALGLAYRYRFDDNISIQASAVLLQDRNRLVYPVIFEFFGFTGRQQIVVEQRNTLWLNVGGGYEFQTPLEWLSGLAQLDLGMATRDIRIDPGNLDQSAEFNSTIFEDERFITLRGGIEMAVWRSDNLLIQGGISYAQFMPVESEMDPFGGFGWRFSVFPVWSAE